MGKRSGVGCGITGIYWSVVVCALLLMPGCAGIYHEPCPAGGVPAICDTLYFGTDKPGGRVSDSEWQQFLEDFVTKRLPGGFTWWTARGQWRESDGKIKLEEAYVFQVIHGAGENLDEVLSEIIREYRNRFRQLSVLHVRSPACMAQ